MNIYEYVHDSEFVLSNGAKLMIKKTTVANMKNNCPKILLRIEYISLNKIELSLLVSDNSNFPQISSPLQAIEYLIVQTIILSDKSSIVSKFNYESHHGCFTINSDEIPNSLGQYKMYEWFSEIVGL